jgi:hypothetical protein
MITSASSTRPAAWQGVDPSNPLPGSGLPPDRRGRLKNGNRSGDFLAAPRCGARTRCGGTCRQPAMKNGRCRMHGGLSTGPRTPEGLARSRRARLTHGGYSAHARALHSAARAHLRRARTLVALMRGRSAWHGVHPSKFTKPRVGAGFKLVLGPADGRTREPARTMPTRTPASAPVAPSPARHTIRVHLRSSAVQTSFTAGHGSIVHFRCRPRRPRRLAPSIERV